MALLEVADCRPGVFKKKTHLVSVLKDYENKSRKFVVQPYNQSGDKDGKAQAEEPSDLWVFPEIGAIVRVHPKGDDLEVMEYDVVNSTVFLKPTAPPKKSAPAPQTKKRRRRKHTSINKPVTTPTKQRKKALDKATTSSTPDETNHSTVYTLLTVLEAFANPRSKSTSA